MKAIDRLIASIHQKQNPTVVGLDTNFDILPKNLADKAMNGNAEDPIEACCAAILEFNKKIIDGLCDIVPAVKVQIAFYEMYGIAGMQTYLQTIQYAKACGMFVITDAKRGDIGSTAQAYSTAFLGKAAIGSQQFSAFESDMLTINPYFGWDGVMPFVQDCGDYEKGIFVLVKTSNPSGGEFQDLDCGGAPFFEQVAQKVEQWGKGLIGEHHYSSVGAVVGATWPEQSKRLREIMPQTFFLVPGYGAQGGTAQSLKNCFDAQGNGAIVNSSRGILCAYKKQPELNFVDAARQEALRMKQDISNAIGGNLS